MNAIICWFAPADEYTDGFFRILEQSTLKKRGEDISTDKKLYSVIQEMSYGTDLLIGG